MFTFIEHFFVMRNAFYICKKRKAYSHTNNNIILNEKNLLLNDKLYVKFIFEINK